MRKGNNRNIPRIALCEKHKFIYVPIPKTASSSIKLALIPFYDKAKEYEIYKGDALGYNLGYKISKFYWHKVYRENIKIRDIRKFKNEGYVVFTVVRNPWDRLVSCYENKVNDKYAKRRRFKEGASFEEFLDFVCKTPDNSKKADPHWKSQYTFVSMTDKLFVNHICYFESLQDNLNDLFQEIAGEDVVLPHLIRSNRKKDYRLYYTDETREMVAKRFAKDVKLFKYEFEKKRDGND